MLLTYRIMEEKKMTGDITKDIDSIYNMVNYVAACTDKLVEKWQAQDLGITDEYTEIISLQEHMKAAKEYIRRIHDWREPKRVLLSHNSINKHHK